MSANEATMNFNSRWNYLVFILAGFLLAGASLVPETVLSAVFGVACALTLTFGMARTLSPKRSMFLFAMVFSATAFYWLPQTVRLFGGLPYTASLFVLLLFCVVSSLQFVLCAWVYERLQRYPWIVRYRLGLSLSWLFSLAVIPRVFPWAIGHCMIAFPAVAAIASFVGIMPISALVIWWGELLLALLESLNSKTLVRKPVVVSVCVVSLLGISAGYVSNRILATELRAATTLKIAMVQGNLAAEQKGDRQQLSANLELYKRLSRKAVAQGAELLVWPESVVSAWIVEEVKSLAGRKDNFFPDLPKPLIFGGLSFTRRSMEEVSEFYKTYPEYRGTRMGQEFEIKRFNAAFGMLPSGEIAGRYYKRVLMPFGEYMPFTDSFPALKQYLPPTGDFSSGELVQPIVFSIPGIVEKVKASILICYEDLIPRLSRQAVKLDANILVNVTNDAWYGKTAAPLQHHLLALWRAVETRRFLLRSTNTGLTAVVDPYGQSVEKLPIFQEGLIVRDVKLLDSRSIYSLVGDWPVWLVCLVVAAAFLLSFNKVSS